MGSIKTARIIVCELSESSIDRHSFTLHLRQIGEAKHLFESTWLVQSDLSCDDLLSHAEKLLGSFDNLLVLNVDSSMCWHTSDDVSSQILEGLKNKLIKN
ncbi:MAG: hypothetical protein OHK0056_18480 [Bacteriovoracaceae bacterium]